MMVHQNGDLDDPVDGSYWWEDGCFKISRSSINYKPISVLPILITTILHYDGKVLKELTRMQIFGGNSRVLRGYELRRKLQRNRNFFQVSIFQRSFRMYPN